MNGENQDSSSRRPRRVLFLDLGDTCRSPMAKAILEEKLKVANMEYIVAVDCAGIDPTLTEASQGARNAMISLFGADLLQGHSTKKLTDDMAEWADLILAMETRHVVGLPAEKTFILASYAGVRGEIEDPWGGNNQTYVECAKAIANCLDKAFSRIVGAAEVP